MSGTMGFHEFKELSQVLNSWKMTFASYDRDHSGTVEGHELQQAITHLGNATAPPPHTHTQSPGVKMPLFMPECLDFAGYNLSPQAMNVIMKRFSTHGRITFDDFIACCVKLRALTGE